MEWDPLNTNKKQLQSAAFLSHYIANKTATCSESYSTVEGTRARRGRADPLGQNRIQNRVNGQEVQQPAPEKSVLDGMGTSSNEHNVKNFPLEILVRPESSSNLQQSRSWPVIPNSATHRFIFRKNISSQTLFFQNIPENFQNKLLSNQTFSYYRVN